MIYNIIQNVALGSTVSLEVLKYNNNRFSFHWTKMGPRPHSEIRTTSEPNVLSFQCVREEDLGYYRCEVKHEGKLVLTVYRALYSSKFSTT